MSARLFEVERTRRARSPDLRLAVRPPVCERGHPELTLRAVQPALFRHGGYGAAEMTEWRICVTCPAVRLRRVIDINPRRINEHLKGSA